MDSWFILFYMCEDIRLWRNRYFQRHFLSFLFLLTTFFSQVEFIRALQAKYHLTTTKEGHRAIEVDRWKRVCMREGESYNEIKSTIIKKSRRKKNRRPNNTMGHAHAQRDTLARAQHNNINWSRQDAQRKNGERECKGSNEWK